MIRPGPPAILPASAPGGVVIHVYSVPAADLLLVQHFPFGAPVDKAAESAADYVLGRIEPGQVGTCLVAYDGDSGERMAWPWP